MGYQEKIGETGEYNAPKLRVSLRDIVDEYNEKIDAIPQVIKSFEDAATAAKMASYVGDVSTYSGSIFERGGGTISAKDMENILLRSAWRHVYQGLQVDRIATAKDKSRLQVFLEQPDEFTLENIRDKFGEYLIDPRHHVLRGLAEMFTSLDPSYKSHDNVKIGVKGLPKRVIMRVGEYLHGTGFDRCMDTINALNGATGRGRIDYQELRELMEEGRKEGVSRPYNGITFKGYSNGNFHLIFDKTAQLEINRALAEYYGETLPDSPEAFAEKKQTSTEVSKDLAFYPTPKEACDHLLSDIVIKPDDKILEPSCGKGAIMEAIRKDCPQAQILGIEVSKIRAAETRAKGFDVLTANFLEVEPEPIYSLVIMNPPFNGKHYQKHVEHAKKFLKEGGKLFAILPASAMYSHEYVEGKKDGWNPNWRDLPVGSFSESGTNVPTGIYRYP